MGHRKPNSFAVIGSGALGGLYGAMLARAGFDVHFLLHSDFEHVAEHGLRVESILGDFHLPRPQIYRSAEDLPACDVTLVALKTTMNALLPDVLPPSTRGGGAVLVLQNGLGVEAEVARVVGENSVLGGCCFLCSNKVGPGHIRHLDFGKIVFGSFLSDRNEELCRTIAAEMRKANIDAATSPNLLQTRWQKLMWNIPFNGLSVVLNASTSDLIHTAETYALSESIVREVHDAATRCGAEIPTDTIERTLQHTLKMVAYDSSMRLDFLAKRPLELEAIFGTPLRTAGERGFQMPRVEMLYRQLLFMDWTNRRQIVDTP